MKIFLWADIYTRSGEYQGRIRSINHEILSQSKNSYDFSLSDFDNGEYKALVVAQFPSEETTSPLVASTLLMEYIAPFVLSRNHRDSYVIKDKIDTSNLADTEAPVESHQLLNGLSNTYSGISPDDKPDKVVPDTSVMKTPIYSAVWETKEYVYYTVQSGDWLSRLATMFYGDRMKFMDIFNVNKDVLSDPNRVIVGQKLRIPAAEQAYFCYTVKTGDRLSSIAKKFYGDWVKFETILSANPNTVKNPNHIVSGQNLIIPLFKIGYPGVDKTQRSNEERIPEDFWDGYKEEILSELEND